MQICHMTLLSSHGHRDDAKKNSTKDIWTLESLIDAAQASPRPPHVPAPYSGVKHSCYPVPYYLADAGYDHSVNVAVLGTPGSGKSSLVNALRRKHARDPDGAPVGAVKTTTKPLSYPLAPETLVNSLASWNKMAAVRLWDLPAVDVGTAVEDASRNLGLLYFDVVLVVSCRRVTEADKRLVEELSCLGVPHFVVRTKIDLDVENEHTDFRRSERETVRRVRGILDRNDFKFSFLVSSRQPDGYDMKRLIQSLIATVRVRRSSDDYNKDGCPVCGGYLQGMEDNPVNCASCDTDICGSCASRISDEHGHAPCPVCHEPVSDSESWFWWVPDVIDVKAMCACSSTKRVLA